MKSILSNEKRGLLKKGQHYSSSIINFWYDENGIEENVLDPNKTWINSVLGGFYNDLIPVSDNNFILQLEPGQKIEAPQALTFNADNITTITEIDKYVLWIRAKDLFNRKGVSYNDGFLIWNDILGIKTNDPDPNLILKVWLLNQVGKTNQYKKEFLYGLELNSDSNNNINEISTNLGFKGKSWNCTGATGNKDCLGAKGLSTLYGTRRFKKIITQNLLIRSLNSTKKTPIYIELINQKSSPSSVTAISYPGEVPRNALQLFKPAVVKEKFKSRRYKKSELNSSGLSIASIIVSQDGKSQKIESENNGGYLNLVNQNHKLKPILLSPAAQDKIARFTIKLNNPTNKTYSYRVWIDYLSNPDNNNEYNFFDGSSIKGETGQTGDIQFNYTLPKSSLILNDKEINQFRMRIAVVEGNTLPTQNITDGSGEVEDYIIQLTSSDCIRNIPEDYITYAEEILPYCGNDNSYTAHKTRLDSGSGSYQKYSNDEQNDNNPDYIKGMRYKVGVEKDIPFATSWGKFYSFLARHQPNSDISAISLMTVPRFCENQDFGINPQIHKLRQLKMDVYYPKPIDNDINANNLNKIPVIIQILGGGYVRNDDGDMQKNICRWLASQGYLVAAVDYRLGMTIQEGQLAKRTIVKAWQDIKAAVSYWRYEDNELDTPNSAYKKGEHMWNVDASKIYGIGHSAGGVNVLHNIYLTDEIYRRERHRGNLLFSTTGEYEFSSLISHTERIISNLGYVFKAGFIERDDIPMGYRDEYRPSEMELNLLNQTLEQPINSEITYDLNDYPTYPCIKEHKACNTSIEEETLQIIKESIQNHISGPKSQFNKGIAFSGALMKKDWMNGNQTPVANIHHSKDNVVYAGDGVAFGYIGDFLSNHTLGLNPSVKLENMYGGKSMEEFKVLNENGNINYTWIKLSGENKGGGSKEAYHRSTQKFGQDNRDGLELSLMYYLDAFFIARNSSNDNENPDDDLCESVAINNSKGKEGAKSQKDSVPGEDQDNQNGESSYVIYDEAGSPSNNQVLAIQFSDENENRQISGVFTPIKSLLDQSYLKLNNNDGDDGDDNDDNDNDLPGLPIPDPNPDDLDYDPNNPDSWSYWDSLIDLNNQLELLVKALENYNSSRELEFGINASDRERLVFREVIRRINSLIAAGNFFRDDVTVKITDYLVLIHSSIITDDILAGVTGIEVDVIKKLLPYVLKYQNYINQFEICYNRGECEVDISNDVGKIILDLTDAVVPPSSPYRLIATTFILSALPSIDKTAIIYQAKGLENESTIGVKIEQGKAKAVYRVKIGDVVQQVANELQTPLNRNIELITEFKDGEMNMYVDGEKSDDSKEFTNNTELSYTDANITIGAPITYTTNESNETLKGIVSSTVILLNKDRITDATEITKCKNTNSKQSKQRMNSLHISDANLPNRKQKKTDLSVFPNPAKDRLNIIVEVQQPGPLHVEIFSLNQTKVFNLQRHHISEGHQLIALNGIRLSSGTYILKVKAGNVNEKKRVVFE